MFGSHAEAVHHLVRRGMEARIRVQTPQEGYEAIYNIPTHAIIILGLSAAACLLFLTSVRYTLWAIVSTLAEVESPTTTYVVREEKSSRGSDALAEEVVDSEVTVIKQKPVTSKIRATIHHLHARAGFASRWRGLSLFAIYTVTHAMLSGFFANLLGAFHYPDMASVFVAKSIGSVIATITLARFSTAWVHIVISEPSPKAWYRRVPSVKSWKNVWAPSALVDITTRLAFGLPALCAIALGLDPENARTEHPGMLAFKALTCVALGLLTVVALVIPASVALVRVQASMLPEDVETIVPFDRTFGGKVVPEILGGSGAIGFVEAWRTFDMAARVRIMKLFAKFVVVEIGLHLLFAVVLGAEAVLMIRPEHIRQLIGKQN